MALITIVAYAAMPIWNKAATAQLKRKIAEGVVPTNPAELTNDYIYGTLSAIHFPDYHLTGPHAQASVIRRFRKLFDNIQAENGLTGARRGKFLKIHLDSFSHCPSIGGIRLTRR